MSDYVKETYGHLPMTTYPHKLAAHLVKEYNLYGSILDLGCGRGEYLNGFMAAGLEGYGRDLHTATARKIAPTATILMQDIESPDWYGREYDTVFLKSVIEHTRRPDEVLFKSFKALKHKGRIIVMTPNWQVCYKTFYGDCTHHTPFTVNGLGQLLRLTGFKQVESHIFYCLPLYWAHPWLRPFIRCIGRFVPHGVGIKHKIVFARKIMILATGVK